MPRFSLEDISLNNYIQAKRDSVIASALQNSRTRTAPEITYYQDPLTDHDKKNMPKYIKDLELQLQIIKNLNKYNTDYSTYYSNPNETNKNNKIKEAVNYYTQKGDINDNADDDYTFYKNWYGIQSPIELDILKQTLTKEKEDYTNDLKRGYRLRQGYTCINTATNNYGKGHQISSNIDFAKNPFKYGFSEVNYKDKKPGDLIQIYKQVEHGYDDNGIIPTHAMIFEGYDEDSIPLFNYSNGGNKPTDYKKAKRYSDNDLKDAKAFRFIGNDQDIKNWTEEYNKRYQNGGIISTPVKENKFLPEGLILPKNEEEFDKIHGTIEYYKPDKIGFILDRFKDKNRDFVNLLRGLNKTFGTAASIASLGTAGGWQTLRLLNKGKGLRTSLASSINAAQKADKYADLVGHVFNPSFSSLIDIGANYIPAKDLLSKSGQIRYGIKNIANLYNLIKK